MRSFIEDYLITNWIGVCVFFTLLLLHYYAAIPQPVLGLGEAIVPSLPGFGALPFKLETGYKYSCGGIGRNIKGSTYKRRTINFGYVGVGERDEVQLFYYFVESERNPAHDPLVLWLTGGPGCSGISGLVYEIGPLRFNKIKYNGTIPSLRLNPYSWTKISSIIFIDSPVGTGFSYSKSFQGYRTGDKLHAHHNYDFLKKWLWNHPRFSKNQVYIAGDSYSGMIVPLIVQEILDDENSKVAFAYHMALIPEQLYKSSKRNCRGDYITRQQMSSQCARDIREISKRIERVNDAHILEPKCISQGSTKIHNNHIYLSEKQEEIDMPTWHRILGFYCRAYFDLICNIWGNDPIVQKSLHVRKEATRFWIRCNRTLDYVQDVSTTVRSHQYLNDKGFRALIYSGDHDMIIPYFGTQSWIKTLNLIVINEWRPWFVEDQVAGYVTEYGNNFTFVTVKGGGHTAPEYLPRECFAMYRRWIDNQPL